tara:strand:- start:59 stop:562 length:504 start_codon:yes stop_codon:yes gene_type:complete
MEPMALQGQLVLQALLVLQVQQAQRVHKAQQVQTVLMALMEPLVLRDRQAQLVLQELLGLQVLQEQLVLTVLMEPMVQLQPLPLARLRLELLVAVQALPTAVVPLLLFLTSRSREELLAQQALKVQLVQTLLSRWGQLLSVQAVLRREPSVTTPRKTGLRVTTVISG